MPSPLRVLLACSGLDHARRGFESFARGCFAAVRDDPRVDIELVKATGPAGDRERTARTLTRDTTLARALARAWGREPFRVEQVAFALSLQPVLRVHRPDVVYFSEWHTGLALAALRRVTRARHRLLLCNGTMAVNGFDHLDLVQQLTPISLRMVLERGADPARQVLLPLGVTMPASPLRPGASDRQSLRANLGLPVTRRIVLSVAALNRHHKRIDYLIDEVARLPEPRPFLLVAGHPEAETAELRALAEQRLGTDGYSFRSVAHDDIADIYRAADVFVLASLGESFGLVLAEAMAHGLPCLTHDYEIPRFVLGEHGHFADFTQHGALTELLAAADLVTDDPAAADRRHRFVYEAFSWERMRPRYVELLSEAANSTVSSTTGEKLSRNSR